LIVSAMTKVSDPEHIAISKSKGIKIDWTDGHRSDFSLAHLRDNCPCATCTGAEGGAPQKTNYSKEDSNPFKMYQPKLKMLNCEEVGEYAIRIYWSDGHSTGIYSFRHLRELCTCPSCMKPPQP
jgi:DUF971 family protein